MEKWWQDFYAFRIFITPKVMPVVFWIGVGIAVIMGILTVVEERSLEMAGPSFLASLPSSLAPSLCASSASL